jgi:hypothetical protein
MEEGVEGGGSSRARERRGLAVQVPEDSPPIGDCQLDSLIHSEVYESQAKAER